MKRKRIRARGSIEELPSGAFRARVRGYMLDGRPIKGLSVTAPTKELAKRALESLKRRAFDMQAGIIEEWTRDTLEQFAIAQQKHLRWRRADNFAWTLLRPLYKRKFIELDPARIISWAQDHEAAGYAYGSVEGAWSLLRRIVRRALEVRAIPRPPWGEESPQWWHAFETRKAKQRDALTEEQWQTLWTAARDLTADGAGGALSDLDLRVLVLRVGGLRPVEVCRLRIEDLNEEAGTIYLHEIAKKREKTGGHIPLGKELCARLRGHIDRMPPGARESGWLFPIRGARSRKTRSHLKWGSRERPRYVRFVTDTERAALKVLGVTWDLYSARHTAATEAMVEAGMRAAAKVLRHEGEGKGVTSAYVHPRAEHYRPMVEAIDESFAARHPRWRDDMLREEPASLEERVARGDLHENPTKVRKRKPRPANRLQKTERPKASAPTTSPATRSAPTEGDRGVDRGPAMDGERSSATRDAEGKTVVFPSANAALPLSMRVAIDAFEGREKS